MRLRRDHKVSTLRDIKLCLGDRYLLSSTVATPNAGDVDSLEVLT